MRTAEWLIELLRPHTPFAEAIVKRQVERAGRTMENLRDDDLPSVAANIVAAASMFLDPKALAAIKTALGLR